MRGPRNNVNFFEPIRVQNRVRTILEHDNAWLCVLCFTSARQNLVRLSLSFALFFFQFNRALVNAAHRFFDNEPDRRQSNDAPRKIEPTRRADRRRADGRCRRADTRRQGTRRQRLKSGSRSTTRRALLPQQLPQQQQHRIAERIQKVETVEPAHARRTRSDANAKACAAAAAGSRTAADECGSAAAARHLLAHLAQLRHVALRCSATFYESRASAASPLRRGASFCRRSPTRCSFFSSAALRCGSIAPAVTRAQECLGRRGLLREAREPARRDEKNCASVACAICHYDAPR